jgi:predicted PurR-regulated permease PerM
MTAMVLQDQDPEDGRQITLRQLAVVVAVAAVLSVAREVFIPLAIAMLITFALSPAVTALRKRGLPKIAAVLGVVLVAFVLIGLFFLVVAGQVAQLADNLPEFQANILSKLTALQEVGGKSGIGAQLANLFSAINTQIGAALPSAETASATAPMVVKLVEPDSAVGMLQSLVLPLISPLASTGIVVVVVVFILLEQEELRDRFLRLIGSNDLHRTTQVMEEAASRVTSYLLVQLLVNAIYAVPIGFGLWLIGVPNALLWGMLTLVLRFVPYVGSILAAAFPLFLAFAVVPDWSAVLWTAALFLTIEMLTSNVIEPWLYGSRTGVSPLAIIVAAIFWTFLWGPLGLVLSTPLTVCLVVLGRYLPQFQLFNILLGDKPVLVAHAQLYQRLMASDSLEAIYRAEEALEEKPLAEFHRRVSIPALLLAQADRERGVISEARQERLAATAVEMIESIAPVTDPLSAEDAPVIACLGGRSRLDDASAAVLAQVLEAEGAVVRRRPEETPATARRATGWLAGSGALVLCFLDSTPSRGALLLARRYRKLMPDLTIGAVVWDVSGEADLVPDGMIPFAPVPKARLAEIKGLGFDFVVTSADACIDALRERFPGMQPPAAPETAPETAPEPAPDPQSPALA